MEDKILFAIASDLGIKKYERETSIQYTHRVLYSAIACWIKAVSMDRPIIGEPMVAIGTSRRHIHDKCSAVLDELLKRYPFSRMWFEPEDAKDNPISIIRTRLLRHGDLVNVGFDTNLAIATSKRIPLTQKLGCIKGVVIQQDITYSGLATVYSTHTKNEFDPKAILSVMDWLTEYAKNAWWKQADSLDEGIEYFNPRIKSKNNHSCWQTTFPLGVNNMTLIRRSVNKNAYEYLLYKPNEKKIHRIDPFLQEQAEHRRFMIGLRAIAGNPVPILVTHHSDHISLRLWIHLPMTEIMLLESYAWPHSSIIDMLEWDMPIAVWDYMKLYMLGLELKITEDFHG